MGYLKIHCCNCKANFKIDIDHSKDNNANTCPVCGQSIDRQTYNNLLLPALGILDDANRELIKDTGYTGQTLFRVSYQSKY